MSESKVCPTCEEWHRNPYPRNGCDNPECVDYAGHDGVAQSTYDELLSKAAAVRGKPKNIEAWAKKLAEDSCNAGEIEYGVAQPSPQPRKGICDTNPKSAPHWKQRDCENWRPVGESEQGGNVSGGIYEGPNGEELHGDGREVASPSAALSDIMAKIQWVPFAGSVYASHAHVVAALQEAAHSGSQPTAPRSLIYKQYDEILKENVELREQIVSLTQERDTFKDSFEKMCLEVGKFGKLRARLSQMEEALRELLEIVEKWHPKSGDDCIIDEACDKAREVLAKSERT